MRKYAWIALSALLLVPLAAQGLNGNDEVPYFILPYEPAQKLGSYSNMTNYHSGLVKVHAEYFGSNSYMVGKQFNEVLVPLNKVGNPAGQVIIASFYGTEPVKIKKEFCRINVTDITPNSRAYYSCWMPTKYAIERYDHIGVFYNATNPYGSYVQTFHSNSPGFDGPIYSRERVSRMSSDEPTSWWHTPGTIDGQLGYDMSMILTDEWAEPAWYEPEKYEVWCPEC